MLTISFSATQSAINPPSISNTSTSSAATYHQSNAPYHFSKLSMIDIILASQATCEFSPLTSPLLFAFHGYCLPLLQCQIFFIIPLSPVRTTYIPFSPLIPICNFGLYILKYILAENHHIFLSNPSTYNVLPYISSITFYHHSNFQELLVKIYLYSRTPLQPIRDQPDLSHPNPCHLLF